MNLSGIHRQWGQYDMLYFCPKNKIVWQYDRLGKIHKFEDMPTYGLERKIIKEEEWGK
tara:strand:- start:23434 stop:23607 length:174 start_codon:yes stop_codon:yes gene_type:complete